MTLERLFVDRRDAGRMLSPALATYARRDDVVVLGLPRGGVPVAYEVAAALELPLDVFLVRKLGVPGHEELAMGAIASGGVRVLNRAVLAATPITSEELDAVSRHEQRLLSERELDYRGARGPLELRDQVAMVVDDGLATGATMRAAVEAIRGRGARRTVIAVPVAPPQTCAQLRQVADEVVCALTPENFVAVGNWYEDFSPVADEQVRELLGTG